MATLHKPEAWPFGTIHVHVYLDCDWLCPENRQCGPEDDMDSVCCTFDEYCERGAPAGTLCPPGESYCCLPRPD